MLKICIQGEGPVVPRHIEQPRCALGPGLEPARGGGGATPAGEGPGCLVKFFLQVVWLVIRVRGSLYTEVADCETEPHSVRF